MGYAMVRERAKTEYAGRQPHAPADVDLIEDLGYEIATLASQIHAATQRLLVLIARFDEMRGWEPSGQRDCAHWLAVRTGIDLGAARQKVRVARALAQLPLTSAAMAKGQLSFSRVRALVRAATTDNEGALLELARGATAAQLERVVRGWKKGSRQDEAQRELERFESRALSIVPDDDEMYLIRGRLTPEVGALLMRAIDAASDEIFRAQHVPGVPEPESAALQRRADALALLAERAMSGNTVSGGRAERHQVVLHVDSATLLPDREPGRSEFEDGTRVSAETSRWLACDAQVIQVAREADGAILDVGRKTRTVPPAIRRALEIRDRGCRFPGCGRRFTDAHHVKHWAEGGQTSVANCLLLCRHHHRLVHEGGWQIVWWGEGRPAFIDPRGGTQCDARWTAPTLAGDPVAALVRENQLMGANPDGWTAGSRWERECEIPDPVYLRALEAV